MRSPTLLVCGFLGLALAAGSCAPLDEAEDASVDSLQFVLATGSPVVTDAASTGGVSWADFDGDGDLDLLVTNGYDVSAAEPVPQPNRLYRNDGLGKFTPLTEGPVVTDEGYSSGHTWGDYDNDGDLDLFVTNQQDQDNFLYRNDGAGALVRITEGVPVSDGGHSYAAAWVDVDRDGLLDLFVANGGLSHLGANALYRNLGDEGFAKIAEGEIVTDEAPTCGFAWGDYDDDGDPDLLVANQGFNPASNNNALYRNDGGWVFTRLEDVPAGNDHQPSCAANWVDHDNDGDLDLYVANLYGLANLLYRNEGSGMLTPVMDDPAAVEGNYSYSTAWEDFDNDGDLDLACANWGAAPDLYLNDGKGNLERARAGDFGRAILHGATMACGDYDDDGDVDIYIGDWPNSPGPGELNQLYTNQGGPRHWLRVRLVGTVSNRAGIGARITAIARIDGESRTQTREVSSHTGFRSQSALDPHFGLGDARRVDELVVRWPSGDETRIENVDADQVLTITEGD